MSGIRIGRVFRGKMRLRVTIALLAFLALAVCVWLFIREQRLEASSPDTIDVYMDEMLAGRIDREWFAELESVEVEIRGENIVCVPLIDTLESMNARPTSQEAVVIEGAGGPISVPAESIFPRWGAYIVYEEDGEPLSPENGGPYRAIILEPDGSEISISGVRKITVQLME